MSPGEIFEGENTCYDILNPARNEQRYLKLLQKRIGELNISMPLHAVLDSSRNGVQGIRRHWNDSCNVAGAGFGYPPSSNTKDSNLDAFVWVKNGGVSDGTSDTNSASFASDCGKDTALKPMPEKGEFSQQYFEMLLRNARPHVYSRSTELQPRAPKYAHMCG
jgi:cellulose 1,4-beta-cellobiosidase